MTHTSALAFSLSGANSGEVSVSLQQDRVSPEPVSIENSSLNAGGGQAQGPCQFLEGAEKSFFTAEHAETAEQSGCVGGFSLASRVLLRI
jgi:hypothetical protein